MEASMTPSPTTRRSSGSRSTPSSLTADQDLLRLLHRLRRRARTRHVCPVCLGMPGVLPVLNRQVVELAVRAGLAARLRHPARRASSPARTTSTRTSPRATRSRSTSCPSASAAASTFEVEGVEQATSGLTRIHLEEDAGKNLHDVARGRASLRRPQPRRRAADRDRLRAGPPQRRRGGASTCKRSATSSSYLDVCDGNMEEGSFRCDANVSVRARAAQSSSAPAPSSRT